MVRLVGFNNATRSATRVLSASLLMSVYFTSPSLAQHETHDMSATGAAHVITMPDNDEVLAVAPESIMLHFESDVRLVKLALKEPSQGKEPIDIDFRYQPGTGVHFVHALPELAAADYYTVEWAAFDTDANLIRGVFYFSFGENARPPSSYTGRMEHSGNIISPDYRLQ